MTTSISKTRTPLGRRTGQMVCNACLRPMRDLARFATFARRGTLAFAVAGVAAAGAFTAAAQEVPLGLEPYVGCWQPQDAELDAGVLCFVPSAGRLEMITVADGAVQYREPFAVDGQMRTIEQDGCRIAESAQLSEDRRRIYTMSNSTCDEEPPSRSTGIISMPTAGRWLDVRMVDVEGAASAWSRWYHRTGHDVLEGTGLSISANAQRSARRAAASAHAVSAVEVDDVIDAAAAVDARAVEAWIAEVGQEFKGLDADDIVRMDDAGVPGSVVDVVVAVSFPSRFALGDRRQRADRAATDRQRFGARPVWAFGGWYDPFYSGGYYGYGYGGYGFGNRYGGWGRYSYWPGYYTPVVVEVTPTQPRTGGGRVVAGRGYRRPPSDRVNPSGFVAPGSGRSSVGSGSSSRGGAGGAKSSGSGRKAKRRGGS